MAVTSRAGRLLAHLFLIIAILVFLFPVYIVFVASTHGLPRLVQRPAPVIPGSEMVWNYLHALTIGARTVGAFSPSVLTMLKNSLIMAVGITLGKIFVSFLAAPTPSSTSSGRGTGSSSGWSW